MLTRQTINNYKERVMAAEHENHRRLHEAGLIDKEHLAKNPDEYEKVSTLSSDEVDTLISIGEKVGGGSLTDPDTIFL